jgi:hypothetical protein
MLWISILALINRSGIHAPKGVFVATGEYQRTCSDSFVDSNSVGASWQALGSAFQSFPSGLNGIEGRALWSAQLTNLCNHATNMYLPHLWWTSLLVFHFALHCEM